MMELQPDSLWSWLICAASGLSMVIVCGGAYNFGLLLPPLMDHFKTTRQETGTREISFAVARCNFSYALGSRGELE